ncbi:MAG: hypothetical protein WCI74_18590, partial [Actinomycetes bacterium]
MPASPAIESHSKVRRIGLAAAATVVGLVVGFAYLKGIHYGLDVLWTDVPRALSAKPAIAVYVVAMTTLGATSVAYLRRRTDVFGHSPLDGLAVTLDPVRVSLIAVAAVIITLLSGAVLGPEAGLIA